MTRNLGIGISLAALLIASSAWAQEAPGRSPNYDIKHEVVLRGTAAEVKVIPDWMGREGVNVMLKTQDPELVHVDMAPAAFLKFADFSIETGDLLEFTGAWATIEGKHVFLAHSAKKQKTTLSVRGPDGLPIW
jgi:hypothetical protein